MQPLVKQAPLLRSALFSLSLSICFRVLFISALALLQSTDHRSMRTLLVSLVDVSFVSLILFLRVGEKNQILLACPISVRRNFADVEFGHPRQHF